MEETQVILVAMVAGAAAEKVVRLAQQELAVVAVVVDTVAVAEGHKLIREVAVGLMLHLLRIEMVLLI